MGMSKKEVQLVITTTVATIVQADMRRGLGKLLVNDPLKGKVQPLPFEAKPPFGLVTLEVASQRSKLAPLIQPQSFEPSSKHPNRAPPHAHPCFSLSPMMLLKSRP